MGVGDVLGIACVDICKLRFGDSPRAFLSTTLGQCLKKVSAGLRRKNDIKEDLRQCLRGAHESARKLHDGACRKTDRWC
jgi:hypothetical protein